VYIFFLSGFGTGFLPKMPGTWGSALGVLIMSTTLLKLPVLSVYQLSVFWFLIGFLLLLVGYLMLSLYSKKEIVNLPFSSQKHSYDQKWITLDEVVGVIFACIPAFFSDNIVLFFLFGFVLFRIFDIMKPLGIKKIDRLHTPLSVFLDDAVAGLYSAIVLGIFVFFL
jgi:phosphatidylglycerophosphatase A